MLHFTIPVHRHATTVHVAEYGHPRPAVTLEFHAVTDAATTPPAPASTDMWAHAQQLAAQNDRALTGDVAEQYVAAATHFTNGLGHRQAMLHQAHKDMWKPWAEFEEYLGNIQHAVRHWQRVTMAAQLREAYAAGGTTEMAGLVTQLGALLVPRAMVASAGTRVSA